MNIKQKRSFLKSKLLKFILLTPMIISIPFINTTNDVKAGLEFQWDQDSNYRRLKWFLKDNQKKARNKIFFFLRPSDRKAGLLKISLALPKKFKSTLKEDKISLCKVKIGGFDSRTKCLQDIPADVEINESEGIRSIDIFPYSPIPASKDSYAVVLKLYNPRKSGLYQIHSYGQLSGQNPVSRYIGSWTIVID